MSGEISLDSIPKDLVSVEELMLKGELKKALKIINNIEKKEDLRDEDNVSCLLLKSEILIHQGLYKDAYNSSKYVYEEILEIELNLQSCDALILMAKALWLLDNLNKALDTTIRGEILLSKLKQQKLKEILKREASLAWIKGSIYCTKGNTEQGLENLERSLELREQIGEKQLIMKSLSQIGLVLALYKGEIDRALKYTKLCNEIGEKINDKLISPHNFLNLGIIYGIKGETSNSLMYFEKSLKYFEKIDNKPNIAIIYNNIGERYRIMGKIDLALFFLEKSLTTFEEIGFINKTSMVLDSLINASLAKPDNERANQYLHRLKQLDDLGKDRMINLAYRVNKALILKTSSRSRNRLEAEELLKQVLDEDIVIWEITLRAILNLCDLLLVELKFTNDIDLLNEINPLITQLLYIAENQNSSWIMCEAYFLQAKLALIILDIEEARRLLTKAQNTAEKNGLKLLAKKISNEHDELLKQLAMWEDLKSSKVSIGKRIELAHLNELIDRMVHNRAITIPEIEVEEPVLLTIVTLEGNVLLFNPFTSEMTIKSTRFLDFLTSINKLCDEIDSESFNRIKFGQFIVVINTVDTYFICYLFRGQSFSAQQKLAYFSEAVEKDYKIWILLETANLVNKIIKVNEEPHIEELIFNSFLSDHKKFRMPFKAYKGKERYVFASYAHRDKLQVYPIIDYLNKSGINIWYDEGIPISENFKKSIAVNLDKSSLFLVFISPHILGSEYVSKEIKFALKRKKPFYAVYLKETKLSTELEFEIADIQSLMKYKMEEHEFYIELNDILSSRLQIIK